MSGLIDQALIKTGRIGRYDELVNQPCFMVRGNDSTNTSTPTATETLINFPTVVYDPSGYFDTGTDRWTPTNGKAIYYYVYAMGGFGTGNDYDDTTVNIRMNNSTRARISFVNKESNTSFVSTILLLDGVDDYINVYQRHSAGTTKNSINTNYQSQFGAFALSDMGTII